MDLIVTWLTCIQSFLGSGPFGVPSRPNFWSNVTCGPYGPSYEIQQMRYLLQMHNLINMVCHQDLLLVVRTFIVCSWLFGLWSNMGLVTPFMKFGRILLLLHLRHWCFMRWYPGGSYKVIRKVQVQFSRLHGPKVVMAHGLGSRNKIHPEGTT